MFVLPVKLKRKFRKCSSCGCGISSVAGVVCVFILLKFCQAIFRTRGVYSIEINDQNPRLQSPSACPQNGSSVYLFIAVPSAVANFKERESVRKTWGKLALVDFSIRLAFFVGNSDDTEVNYMLGKENLVYNDIIKVDVKEKYENLVEKSIYMLKWLHMNCNRAKYVLKVDDDIFLNIRNLLKHLKQTTPDNSIIGCKVKNTSPFRFPLSKWYISRQQYKDDTFPDYISGPAYLITGDILSELYFATKHVPRIFLEDVYINGLCRRHIKARAEGHPGFSCGYRDEGPCGTNFRYKVTGHHYFPAEMERMWKELNDQWYTCPFKHSYWVSKFIYFFVS